METVYTRALTQYVSHMVECEKAFDELSKRIEACARDCATNCGPPRSCNSQCHEGHHHENLNATKRTKRTADARTKLRTLRGDFAQFHPDIPHEAYVRAGLSISQWLQTGGTMEKWQVVRTAQWQRAAYAPGNWDDSKVPNSVRLEGLNADSFAFWALYARIRHRNAALLKAADYFKKKDHPLKVVRLGKTRLTPGRTP